MSSPARKRMRLSSPTYEGDLEDLDADGLDELDRIEITLSQQQQQQSVASSSSQRPLQSSQALSQDAKRRRLKAIMQGLQGNDDKIGSGDSEHAVEKSAQEYRLGFNNAATLSHQPKLVADKYDHEPSSSLEEPQPEKDYSKWFEPVPDADISLPGFQLVSKSHLALSSDDSMDKPSALGFTSANRTFSGLGFSSAVNVQKNVLEPSKAALELAAKKLKEWSTEDETLDKSAGTSRSPPKPVPGTDVFRPVLASVSNSPSFRPVVSPKLGSFSSPLLNRTNADKPRTFKSPFIGQASSRVYPKGGAGGTSPSKNGVHASRSARPHPLAFTPVTGSQTPGCYSRTVSDSSLQFTTPARRTTRDQLGSTSRPLKPAFSTPFKQGMKPGDPGRAALEKAQQMQKEESAKAQKPPSKQSKADKTRKTALRNSGLRPQQYTSEELEDMGVNIPELSQITPQTAPFYVFHSLASHASSTQTQNTLGTASDSLGPAEALAHLQQTGRDTTREWVSNHWALVLWKLAGLATLDPPREATSSRRWCWRAVLEQLERRHDKEFEKGARPALRLITTGDAPAASPLVLVVTAILFSEEERLGQNGRVEQDASAQLEVSDGWYRLRAFVDAPLARAVVRGIIRPGRKIAVAGAKLDNDKKDPCEILEAYESCSLLLSGNGSHLAPWHAQLGFQARPFMATLGSLTHDGGPVPLVDFVVEKVHPVAFFEFLPGSKRGEKAREGPRGEAEETAIEYAWRKRRDVAESKVREEINARWARWEGFAERLERAAGGRFNPQADDMPPDHIEDLFDELDAMPPAEIGPFIRLLGADECGWLARYLRRRSERDRELAAEEIDLEVTRACPPREVRNFRIVQVRDARTERRPANRVAHLCIWDVLSLCVSEGGKAGAIEPGQRFLMTSLVPMQHSCWMGRAKGDMVYLSTTRSSRFIRLK